jgi:hypothetical protein
MKKNILLLLTLWCFNLYSQNKSLSINMGIGLARSNQDYSFLIGEWGPGIVQRAKETVAGK